MSDLYLLKLGQRNILIYSMDNISATKRRHTNTIIVPVKAETLGEYKVSSDGSIA